MKISTLNELLIHKEDGPCVSIIVSTELKSFSDKEKIELKFKNIIDLVTKQLQTKYDKKMVKPLIHSIKTMLKQINLNHLQNGIGIYAAPNFIRQVSFPFSVNDKIFINRYFEVSDLIATLDKLVDYSVLILSKNNTRFFKGKGNELNEIIDKNFPQHFENEYQLERTPSQYMKNNGVEVSQVNDIRIEKYFREIDKLIDKFVKKEPLVILGITKYLSTFKTLSKHKNLIIAALAGNYDKSTTHSISQLVWSEVENYSEKKNKKDRMKEKALDSSHF